MTFTHTVPEDLEVLEELYRLAIEYQRTRTANPWQGMNRPLIEKEIHEQLHWKIIDEGCIASFFSVAFSDRLVWDERDADPSIYLHRIVTNPSFRGRGYVKHIVAWAEDFGRAMGKLYIRLDTGRDNQRLNAYYSECGFKFSGVKQFDDPGDPAVPRHYLGSGLSLYERKIMPLSST
ncbi:MAG TPA: GNAT family N-acetyltransferase [Puia sp.]|jgi:ribosomal protein S18 acetylase RimI-like enzyme|nr:GNAT family N-acetyltransferase [Puia sp.]